jgi:hypothetical protein
MTGAQLFVAADDPRRMTGRSIIIQAALTFLTQCWKTALAELGGQLQHGRRLSNRQIRQTRLELPDGA